MVSLCMKRDGRSLDRQTQEAIRLMAIERIREGERPAEVIEAYGFNRTTIYSGCSPRRNAARGGRVSVGAGSAGFLGC
jgi:DNA invertase Pin-like site-specific DNA recombinase